MRTCISIVRARTLHSSTRYYDIGARTYFRYYGACIYTAHVAASSMPLRGYTAATAVVAATTVTPTMTMCYTYADTGA